MTDHTVGGFVSIGIEDDLEVWETPLGHDGSVSHHGGVDVHTGGRWIGVVA